VELTEREAVIETIKMWEWLRDNPGSKKYDYLRSVKGLLNNASGWPTCNCYLCTLRWFGSPHNYCQGCPLGGETLCCLINYGDSPYKLWHAAISVRDSSEVAKQAQRIIDACEEWLKNHPEEIKT